MEDDFNILIDKEFRWFVKAKLLSQIIYDSAAYFPINKIMVIK